MSCSELSREEELSDTTLADITQETRSISPTLRIENLLQKCKDTLDTHLASQQILLDTSVTEYFPLTPIESKGSECKSDSNGENRNLKTNLWQEINQELLVRGLPTISLSPAEPHDTEGSYLIHSPCMGNIELVIAQLLQENREQKTLLYTEKETSTQLEYCVRAQQEEIHQLHELLATKDKIIVQLNERCAMFSASCDQLRGELVSPHLGEIETILEESKLSKESLLIAQQRVKRLECELIDLKSSQFESAALKETNPFLQPDVLSRTFDKEALRQLSDRQTPHTSREDNRNENNNELIQQIGSFIRLLCGEMGVGTIAELYTAIRNINETKQETESVVLPVLEECVQLMNDPSLPPKLRPDSYERITLKGFVELMRVWVEEMCGIRCLQEVMQQLTSYAKDACHSGKELGLDSSEDNSVEWSIFAISKMLHSIFLTSKNDKLLSIHVLQGLFSHFSNLFKVREPVNMLTLMSDIQCRFEEMENVLRACKTAIGLEENSSNTSLINSLQNLSLSSTDSIIPISTYDHVELMERVKFYQQFFFHFEWIISKLFKLLNIDKLSDVIPTVEHFIQQLD